MGNYCASCGVTIPPGQKWCSMCYGDPEYGRDGLYKDYLEQQELEELKKKQENENGHPESS